MAGLLNVPEGDGSVAYNGPSRNGPRLLPGTAVIAMDRAVQLRAGDEEIHVIETDVPEVVEKVLLLLAEGRGPETIGETISETIGREHDDLVSALIERLAAVNLLQQRPDNGSNMVDEDDQIARYLSHFTGNSPCGRVQRPSGPVSITGHGGGGELLGRVLGEHGIEARLFAGAELPEDHDAGFRPKAIVCIWEQPDLDMVFRVNAAACRRRTPCLFVDLSHGRHATLGPFYVPGEGSCYQCFRQRWRQNTETPAEFDAAESVMLDRGEPLPAYGILPAFRHQVVGMACAELFAFLSRHRPLRTLNRVATVDLEGLRIETEPSWEIPWCDACGADR